MQVQELWRYPVKSLAGERLTEAQVTPGGIVGDRVVQVWQGPDRVVRSVRQRCVMTTLDPDTQEQDPGVLRRIVDECGACLHDKIAANAHPPRLPRQSEPVAPAGPKEVSPMIATWQLFTVVLLALLVGAVVPVLMQMRRTLKSAENVLESTGPKLDRTLDEVSEAAARINRLGKSLERDAEGLQVFTDAAAGLGRSLKQAQESVRIMTTVGAAVGPAIAAGLRALFARENEDDDLSQSRGERDGATADARTTGEPGEDQAARVDRGARVGHE